MELNDVPARAAGVIGREIDGEMVLVHPGRGRVRVLNPVGARLWELADGQRDVTALAAAMVEEYDVSSDRAAADALAFCEDLVRRGAMIVL